MQRRSRHWSGAPPAGLSACLAGTHRLHQQVDVDAAGLLEHQGHRDLGVLGERRLQLHEHDVIAAGLQRHGGAGRDLQALVELAHAHDVAVHLHLVDLDLGRGGTARRDQPVGRRALVGDGHVAAAGLGGRRRGARPWLSDFQRAELVVLRPRRRREEGRGGDQGKDSDEHDMLLNETWIGRRAIGGPGRGRRRRAAPSPGRCDRSSRCAAARPPRPGRSRSAGARRSGR